MRMSSSWASRVFSVLAILVVFSVSGCGKKDKKEESSSEAGEVLENTLGDSDSGQAMGLQTVNFAYDSYILGSGAKGTLSSNVSILKDKSSLKIQIEGHCDERGGIQYNLALGEKRANAVRKYLMDLGIDGSRITTISFGKERPIDSGSNEQAWAKNRRANFVITSR